MVIILWSDVLFSSKILENKVMRLFPQSVKSKFEIGMIENTGLMVTVTFADVIEAQICRNTKTLESIEMGVTDFENHLLFKH